MNPVDPLYDFLVPVALQLHPDPPLELVHGGDLLGLVFARVDLLQRVPDCLVHQVGLRIRNLIQEQAFLAQHASHGLVIDGMGDELAQLADLRDVL